MMPQNVYKQTVDLIFLKALSALGVFWVQTEFRKLLRSAPQIELLYHIVREKRQIAVLGPTRLVARND